MARLTPDNLNPQLSFRFKLVFSELGDIGVYGKAVQLPTVDNGTIVVDYGNTQLKVKGKTKWNDIDITCYAFEKITMEQLWNYLNKLHQQVDVGEDYYPDDYKKDIQIQLLSPYDLVVGTWKLIGAFVNTLNFGELDYSNEEIVQPRLTISYDYAIYTTSQTQ
jgi:hypothetical protein